MCALVDCFKEEKEEIWLSPMTKAPTPTEKPKTHRDNTKTPFIVVHQNECHGCTIRSECPIVSMSFRVSKRKGKGSDAVVWKTPLNDRQCKSQLHKDAAKMFHHTPIVDRLEDSQFERQQSSNRCGLLKV